MHECVVVKKISLVSALLWHFRGLVRIQIIAVILFLIYFIIADPNIVAIKCVCFSLWLGHDA